jgi:hypothetical protein
MNKLELIKFIKKVFDGVPQPEEITLLVADAHDGYDYDLNKEHDKLDFIGRWQDIPIEHIKKFQSALSFLEKVGMRFYLPAYMVWYLEYFDTDEVWSDSVLYALDNHPNDTKLSKYHEERFSLFSSEQLKACALFVKFCSNDKADITDAYFAQEKYEQYWKQFDEI